MSDQISSYNTHLRKGLKWFRKLMFELILGTCIVNSFILYKETSKNKISITEFKESIIKKDLEDSFGKRKRSTGHIHKLVTNKIKNGNRLIKKRYTICYQRNSKIYSSTYADLSSVTPRINTYCTKCDNFPFMCLECFNTIHFK